MQEENYATVTVKLLLENGADVNARGWYYKTPLHLASSLGYLEVSRLLIEHGADINAQDEEYQTPFSIALTNGYRKLAHFLSEDRCKDDAYAARDRPTPTHCHTRHHPVPIV